ncbi:MAG: chemotaxis protein CheD [Planctomycetes bacterium]|nr:chemotaxis protein CheD [Planctomycetota bacterium]
MIAHELVCHVPIGGVAAVRAPRILTTLLGSCVAFVLQDLRHRVAVLAHVVRPTGQGAALGPGSLADKAAPLAVDLAIQNGADRRDLVVRLAGGGRMFDGGLDIGAQNVAALRRESERLGLIFAGQMVGPRDGGSFVIVDAGTGRVQVRALRTGDDASWQAVLLEILGQRGSA